ncbi:MAG TPA: signal peptidase I [Clostridiales bacterium]|nr:signal peptidase I [Clostridiales bacterium]HRT81732.1 signal peptidase I [Oscillospiraceae bacterium]
MRIKKAASLAINIISSLVFVLSLIVFLTVILNWGKGVPSFMGYSFLSVATESMDPTYPVGCVVISKKTDTAKLQVDDVISFYSDDPVIFDKPNTHRIKAIYQDGQKGTAFITKGDNNPVNDSYPVYADRVIGKVVGSIPSAGRMFDMIKKRSVLFFLLILPLSGVLVYELVNIRKIWYSTDDDEDKKKSKKIKAPQEQEGFKNRQANLTKRIEDLKEEIEAIKKGDLPKED